MKKLVHMSAFAFLFLIAWAGSVFATAPTATAQGGTKPLSVTVINTSGQPVPTTIQGTPTVAVSNLPAVQAPPEPITLQVSGPFSTDGFSHKALSYEVPAGKMLVIEHVSFLSQGAGSEKFRLDITTHHGGGGTHFVAYEAEMDTVQTASEPVLIFASGGTEVSLDLTRSENTGYAGHYSIAVTGYLRAEPPVAP